MTDELELYELVSDVFVLFVRSGVYAYTSTKRWDFYQDGHRLRSGFRQIVNRGEATRRSLEDLARRGFPTPPTEAPTDETWADYFVRSMPLASCPERVVREIQARTTAQVYLVLEEDVIGSMFGSEGQKVYPVAACFRESDAESWLHDYRREQAEESSEYEQCIRMVSLQLADDGATVVADLNIRTFERYGLDDICRLLTEQPPTDSDT